MELATRYLGLELESPLVVGASPATADLDEARRLEDAGAAAVVLPSLFEEEVVGEEIAAGVRFDESAGAFDDERGFLPAARSSPGPDAYFERLALLRRSLGIPVVADIATDANQQVFARHFGDALVDEP